MEMALLWTAWASFAQLCRFLAPASIKSDLCALCCCIPWEIQWSQRLSKIKWAIGKRKKCYSGCLLETWMGLFQKEASGFLWTGMYITEFKEQHMGESDVFTSYFKLLPFWSREEVVYNLCMCKYMSVGHCRCQNSCVSLMEVQPGPCSFPHTGGPEQGRELLMGPNFYISSKIYQTDFHSLFSLYQLFSQLHQLYQFWDKSGFQIYG